MSQYTHSVIKSLSLFSYLRFAATSFGNFRMAIWPGVRHPQLIPEHDVDLWYSRLGMPGLGCGGGGSIMGVEFYEMCNIQGV